MGRLTPPEVLCAPVTALSVLAKRADFLSAARSKRVPTSGFMIQARKRPADEGIAGLRVGFTCSKKVGNAVARNRAKRRLREAARHVLPLMGHDGWDYVLIGRHEATATRPFEMLLDDLRDALRRIHT